MWCVERGVAYRRGLVRVRESRWCEQRAVVVGERGGRFVLFGSAGCMKRRRRED